MKKIIYGILFTILLLVPLTNAKATIITQSEAKTMATTTVNNRAEIDNIYIAADRIYVNRITAELLPPSINPASIVKYNTETGKWVKADGTVVSETLFGVTRDDNGNVITKDEISSYEELVLTLAQTENAATTLELQNDLTGLSKPILIDREVTIDGKGKTINFSKQLIKSYGIKINTNQKVSLTNLNVNITERRSYEDRVAIQIVDSTDVTIGKMDVDASYYALTINDSKVVVNDNINITNQNEYSDSRARISGSSSEVSTTNNASVINNNEIEGSPSIIVDPSNNNIDLGEDTAKVDNPYASGTQLIYLDKDNSKYTFIELSDGTSERIKAVEAPFSVSVSSSELDESKDYKMYVTYEGAGTLSWNNENGVDTFSETAQGLLYTVNVSSSNIEYSNDMTASKEGNYLLTFTLKDEEGKTVKTTDYAMEVYEETPTYPTEIVIDQYSNNYVLTDDTELDEYTVYYERCGYDYCSVDSPTIEDISSYYEYINLEEQESTDRFVETYENTYGAGENVTFNGTITAVVKEKAEGSTVTIKYNGEVIDDVNGAPVELKDANSFSQLDEVVVDADKDGYYEVDLILKDEQGNVIDTTSVDFIKSEE